VSIRTALPCTEGGGLVRKLSACGSQTDADQCQPYIPQRTNQLLMLPGAVVYHGTTYHAPVVRYVWRTGKPVELTLELREPTKPVARVGCGQVVLETVFAGWGSVAGKEPEQGETSARLRPDRHDGEGRPSWAMLDAQGRVDETASLTARVLTPFVGRDDEETSGLYVSRLPGDAFLAVVAPGQPPLALGQAHEYDADREKTAVSLAATSITLTVSPTGTPEDDADSLRLTSGQVRLAARDRVALMKNGILTVQPAAVTAATDVTARKSLTVEGAATVKKDLLVDGNAAVKKELEAGSA
jgi:hypothetical protein